MNLEFQLQNFIDKINNNHGGHFAKISAWRWADVPQSIRVLNNYGCKIELLFLKMDILIEKSSTEDCLETKNEYIINCKKWTERNKLQEKWVRKYF